MILANLFNAFCIKLYHIVFANIPFRISTYIAGLIFTNIKQILYFSLYHAIDLCFLMAKQNWSALIGKFLHSFQLVRS